MKLKQVIKSAVKAKVTAAKAKAKAKVAAKLAAKARCKGGKCSPCSGGKCKPCAVALALLLAATSIGGAAFQYCRALASVDFGDTPRSSVPTLGSEAFSQVPTSCKIIVPYAQYDAWISADGWKDLVTAGYQFVRHAEKADKPATFTPGNLAKFDANGNPVDAGYHFEVRNGIPCIVQYT